MRNATKVILAIAAVFLLLAQNCPDYSKDGSTGSTPAGTPASPTGRTFHIDSPPSNPLRCNTFYYTQATSHDMGVGCANYNFTSIYNEADSAAQKRANEMKCPTMDCSTLQTLRVWHSWNCAGGNADATVVWVASCPRKEAPKALPTEQPKATKAQLAAPNPNATAAPATTEKIDSTGGGKAVGCPPPVTVVYHYEVAEAKRPGDLQAYVAEAEARAQSYAAGLACGGTCKKQPFAAAQVSWSWNAGVVHVDVTFIPCK